VQHPTWPRRVLLVRCRLSRTDGVELVPTVTDSSITTGHTTGLTTAPCLPLCHHTFTRVTTWPLACCPFIPHNLCPSYLLTMPHHTFTTRHHHHHRCRPYLPCPVPPLAIPCSTSLLHLAAPRPYLHTHLSLSSPPPPYLHTLTCAVTTCTQLASLCPTACIPLTSSFRTVHYRKQVHTI
jgi:hypothetical protein